MRWTGTGQVKINDYIIYYKGMDVAHQFGMGFAVHKNYEMGVKEFNPVKNLTHMYNKAGHKTSKHVHN